MRLGLPPLHILATAALSFACISPALAKHAWDGWKVGSSITFERLRTVQGKTTKEEVTQTLKSVNKSHASVLESTNGRPSPLPFECFDLAELGFVRMNFKSSTPVKIRDESISIDGKTYNCSVMQSQETSFPQCGNDESTETKSEVTSWQLQDGSGKEARRIVKSTRFLKDNRPPQATASTTRLVHLQTPVPVGKEVILCDLFETVDSFGPTTTLEWKTDKVPLGFTKRQIVQSGKYPSEYTETLLQMNHK